MRLRFNSIKRTWFLSFGVILVVPLIFMTITFSLVNGILIRNVIDYHQARLEKLKTNTDLFMAQCDSFGVSVISNHAIAPLTKGVSSPNTLREATAALQTVRTYNEYLSEIILYLPEDDIVVTSSSANKRKLFDYAMFSGREQVMTEWEQRYKQEYKGEFFLAQFPEERNPVYAKTFKTGSTEINLFIVLDIKRMIEGNLTDEKFFIIDQNGLAAGSESTEISVAGELPELYHEEGGVEIRKDDVVLTVPSAVANWTYIMVSNKDTFLSGVNIAKIYIIVGLAISLILGELLAVLLLRRNYQPIQRLKEQVNPVMKDDTGIKNEYSYLNLAISKVMREKDQYQHQLYSSKQILREHFLASLMHQRFQPDTVEEKLKYYDIPFRSERFAVLRLLVNDYEESEFENDLDTLLYAIKNISEEIFLQHYRASVLDHAGEVYLILNLDDQELDLIESDADNLLHTIKEYIGVSINIVLSRIHKNGIDGIAAAYEETLKAYEYKISIEQGEIISSSKVLDTEEDEFYYYYPVETEVMILNALKSGNFAKARELVEHVLDENKRRKGMSQFAIRYLAFDIGGTMIKALGATEKSVNKDFNSDTDFIQILLACRSIEKLKEQVILILNDVCAFIRANKTEEKESIGTQVKEYVDKNYQDSNLNISAIADGLGFNPAYLSRAYKAETGIGLLNYINYVRISAAKEILKENPRISIEKLCEQVGFSNSRTFRRVFTKETGISPTKYRA